MTLLSKSLQNGVVHFAIKQGPGKGSVNKSCECVMTESDLFKLPLLGPTLIRFNMICITGCE